jgi:chaperone modulatory protein CbpM
MANHELIPAEEFCYHHHVEITLIRSLHDAGLITITEENGVLFIPDEQLPGLERMLRLHNLDINIEGIETVTHLLEKIHSMQRMITAMKNRLRMYEDEP